MLTQIDTNPNVLQYASHEWRTRPLDERFLSLTSMQQYLNDITDSSFEKTVDLKDYEFRNEDGEIILNSPSGFNSQSRMSHHSFSQMCARLAAPASYLRTLPSKVAVDALNAGIANKDEEVKLYIRGTNDRQHLRAVTGPRYGRIFNRDIVQFLISRFGNGVSGQFKIPGIKGNSIEEINIKDSTLFASQSDMFIFLVDEDPNTKIEVKNRRNGQPGLLSRGFMVWNSETGDSKWSSTFGITTFLYDWVCQNKCIFGATDILSFKIRHTSKAPEYLLNEFEPKLVEYASGSPMPFLTQIEKAQRATIDAEFITKQLGPKLAASVNARHIQEENRPIETLWDLSVGITAHARELEFSDDRVTLERQGGEILNLAA